MSIELRTRSDDWDGVDQVAMEAELFANGHGGFPEAPIEVVPMNKTMAGMHGAAILLHDGMPAIVPDSAKRAGSDNFIG